VTSLLATNYYCCLHDWNILIHHSTTLGWLKILVGVNVMIMSRKEWNSKFLLNIFLIAVILRLELTHSLVNHVSGELKTCPVCERISSLDAASLIENAYRSDGGSERARTQQSLLVITSDASRGANKISGLSSILREIKFIEKNLANDTYFDRVTLSTRRIHTQNARDISKSEVAAAALGIKTALKHIPIENRVQVLLLTDSSSVLDFFCGGSDDACNNIHIPASLLNNPHYKAMQSLLKDAMDNANESPGMRILMAKVKSNKVETDGFFDHEANDILASIVRSISNKRIGEIYSFTSADRESRHEIVEAPSTRRIVAPTLRSQDLDFLALSEEKVRHKHNKPQVIMKRERGDRLLRCKQRIMDELGIQLET